MSRPDAPSTPGNARTLNVERVVRDLVSLPLMRENVFHSAKYLDGKTEKEVCDLLLVHRGEAIVVSIKAQEKKRDEAGTHRWLKKTAGKATGQLGGAFTTLKSREYWCEHGMRGRVRFHPGELRPRHNVALLESRFETLVEIDRTELDRLRAKTPLTLMGIADFLYVAKYLRTWRDLVHYLESRSAVLREPDTHTLGAEPALFAYYTAMQDSFSGCTGIADAKLVRAAGKHIREGSAFRDKELALASIFEGFIEQISTAGNVELPEDAHELREQLPPLSAGGRDVLREDLCDLTIQERAAIGEQIGTLSERVLRETDPEPLFYGAVRFNTRPEMLFVIVVGRDVPHGEASASAIDTMIAGCVHYGKTTGVLLLANQVGPDLQHTLSRFGDIRPTVEYAAVGEELFGHVRPRRTERARHRR